MKKINKYISMVALSALAMAFNACTDECEREASPVQTDGLTAYIDFNTLTSLEFLPDDEQAFEVKIGRQLATETATVHITAEGEKFNVPQTVEFAAGETEKTVKITFDIAIGTSASVKIGIEESETYIYGLTEQTIKVSRDYTWVSAGSLTFSDATFTGAEEELAVEKAKEAGADAIIVSNHGGRVLDQCPATAEVLEEIVKEVNGSMKILVDGGIRSGTDIFKALALGADGVLICRPFVVAVYGGGEEGVKLYIDKLGAELKDAMQMCGAHSVSEITRDMVRYYQD